MAVIEGRTKLQVLSLIACDRHLRSESVGRVAVMVDDHPEIFPVNYAVDERGCHHDGEVIRRQSTGCEASAAALLAAV